MNGWDATITGQAKPLDEEEGLLPLLLRQRRRSAQIKDEIGAWILDEVISIPLQLPLYANRTQSPEQ